MSFQIEVLKVKVEAQGKFRTATVDHKVGGKVDSKRLVSFGAGKAAFDVLSQAQQGDQFDVTSEKIKNPKDGKEYWTWVAAVAAGKNQKGEDAVSSNVSKAVRSSYETTEERAARQVYIVRQNSISNAIAFFEANKSPKDASFTTEDVIEAAQVFEEYVFNGVKEVVNTNAEVS